jgi:SAM-dependent methyltransferase
VITSDPKSRFSNRVEDYVRFRPGYPRSVIDLLRKECGLTAESVVADIGSGTGFLARLFLEVGNVVYGVEPNAPMREAGERLLEEFPKFHSVVGSAEETSLADSSVDMIVAGQAFHWFDRERCRAEFLRILRRDGWVAVIYNHRDRDSTEFAREYERILQTYGIDYQGVKERHVDSGKMAAFFAPGKFSDSHFKNEQLFDFEGLKGRLLSSSYAPKEDHPKYLAMIEDLERIFEAHQEYGYLRLEYDTQVSYGRLAGRT